MKRLVMAAMMAATAAAFADGVQSGDRVAIGDQEFVVVSRADWAALTNRISIIEGIARGSWQMQHATEAGRQAWHGAKVSTVITNGEITVTYKDGYKLTEPVKSQTRINRHVEMLKSSNKAEARKNRAVVRNAQEGLPGALALIREKRKLAASTTNEVTVTIGR